MWRHGDVFIDAIDAIPGDAIRRPGWVLDEGEATGHSHRMDRSETADRLERGGTLYLRVLAEAATVIDRQHRPITLAARHSIGSGCRGHAHTKWFVEARRPMPGA